MVVDALMVNCVHGCVVAVVIERWNRLQTNWEEGQEGRIEYNGKDRSDAGGKMEGPCANTVGRESRSDAGRRD